MLPDWNMLSRSPTGGSILDAVRERWLAVHDRVAAYREGLAGDETRRRRVVRRGAGAGGALLVVAGVAAWLLLRPVPKPDYERDRLDTIFNYTLLTDEFNRLPVEERLRLIGQLVARLQNMDSGSSAMMAAFAAGIAGAARDQIRENGSRLAIDAWDKYAKDYASVPHAEREGHLDRTVVEFTKTLEAVGGRVRDVSDTDRLGEAKRQAARDLKMMNDPERAPSSEEFGRLFSFMREVGTNGSAQQRARGQLMGRDMMRHLRGQDITTGKPK